MIDFNRVIFKPSVSMIAQTVFNLSGVEDALTQLNIEHYAEQPDTPIGQIVGRAFHNPDCDFGGNGDDIGEYAGRQCYNSFGKGRDSGAYHDNIRAQGHGSIYEHVSVVFQVSGVSRSLTHELVRHRAGTAYSQESQRYVDAKDIKFVLPPLIANRVADFTVEQLEGDKQVSIFREICGVSLAMYQELQHELKHTLHDKDGNDCAVVAHKKRANEAARCLLPNACETKLVFTTNLRALRHILTLRGGEAADLEIRRLMPLLLEAARHTSPEFFKDFVESVGADGLAVLASLGAF